MAVGCGAISDVYKSEERGTAMGIFFAVRRYLDIRGYDSTHPPPALIGFALWSCDRATMWRRGYPLLLMALWPMGTVRLGSPCAYPCVLLAPGDSRPGKAPQVGRHRRV